MSLIACFLYLLILHPGMNATNKTADVIDINTINNINYRRTKSCEVVEMNSVKLGLTKNASSSKSKQSQTAHVSPILVHEKHTGDAMCHDRIDAEQILLSSLQWARRCW